MIPDLLLVINKCIPSLQPNKWWWHHSKDGIYSVSSAYSFLLCQKIPSDLHESPMDQALHLVWCSLAPSKVCVFSWKLLQDQIPTREDLLKRAIPLVLGSILCPFRSVATKTSSRLFVTYEMVVLVLYRIFRWLGWVMILPRDSMTLF